MKAILKSEIKPDFRERLLPTSELAAKWVDLLQGIGNKTTKEEREREFLFVHGWLRGLADAGHLSDTDLPELRELATKATRSRWEQHAEEKNKDISACW